MNLKKLEWYWRVNLLGPGPRLMKKNLLGRGLTKAEKRCARWSNEEKRLFLLPWIEVRAPSPQPAESYSLNVHFPRHLTAHNSYVLRSDLCYTEFIFWCFSVKDIHCTTVTFSRSEILWLMWQSGIHSTPFTILFEAIDSQWQWRTHEFCSGGRGSTNSVEDRGQRERGSGGGSPLVRGSVGSCNFVQDISFHIAKFS